MGSRVAAHKQTALSAAVSTSQLRLRKPISATGAQRKYQTAGASASALIPAMRSTLTPEFRSKYGMEVLMNP